MLKERIENDLKEALKKKDSARISTLRFLKAAMQNVEIEKREPLKDEDIIAVIKKQVKQRKDSMEEFKKGNRQDLIDKEAEELKILQGYLPEELSAEELTNIIKGVISETGAASAQDMGMVMKEVMAKTKGRADGKRVSELVKKELSKSGESAEGEKPQDK